MPRLLLPSEMRRKGRAAVPAELGGTGDSVLSLEVQAPQGVASLLETTSIFRPMRKTRTTFTQVATEIARDRPRQLRCLLPVAPMSKDAEVLGRVKASLALLAAGAALTRPARFRCGPASVRQENRAHSRLPQACRVSLMNRQASRQIAVEI